MAEDDELTGLKGDERIVAEAKKRFQRCEDWEAEARKLFIEDLKFVNGDSDNFYQWPDSIRQYRSNTQSPSPCLTINKVAKHCDMIINDGKQNKASIAIRPVGDEATFEAAQIFEDCARHIEYISNADAQYDKAAEFQVQAGVGYLRLYTDYIHADTFDQEIYISAVNDPLSIYIDPDAKELDGSDARFGFEFDDMPRDEFLAQYPRFKDKSSTVPLDNADMWESEHHTRVARYWRKEKGPKDQLVAFKNEKGEEVITRASKLGPVVVKALKEDDENKFRDIDTDVVRWYKIAGDEIIERGEWAGTEIPLFPVIGKQTVIDGVLDRKGHTRAMKDPQRMYNYMASAAVEQTALQGKSPWVVPVRAVEGNETYWNTANITNHAYLPWNDIDDDGQPIQRPERAQLAQVSPAFMAGMATAQDQMMMTSGQYQAQMGENENAKSGKAIAERQRQGDNATYHFIDNQALAMRRIGRNLIELIPKIYDTRRVLKIMAEDGTEKNILIDPNAKQAYLQKQQQHGEAVHAIFNPSVGKYAVQADVGPSYSTKRQEAFNMFERLMASDPQLIQNYGDLMFRACDAPMADELAERMKRGVNPALLGEAPPPALVQAQEQLKQQQAVMEKMTHEIAVYQLKLDGEKARHVGTAQQKDIDVYNAETQRLGTVANTATDLGLEEIKGIVTQTIREMMAGSLQPVVAATEGQLK